MTLKADTDISTEDLIQAAKNMVARATVSGLQVSGPNIQVSAFYGAPVLLEKVAARLQTYHQGVKSFADMLEQHEYAHQFIGSGLIDLVRLDVALAQLTSHDNRAHAGHCVLQETMNEAADLLATAPLFNPGEATMVLVNKAISLLRERPSIRDGRQPTLVEQLVQQLEDATRQCGEQAALMQLSRNHFDQLLESGRCETSAEIELAVNMIDAIDSHLQGRDPKYAMLVTREQHAELTSLLARTHALMQKEATLSAQAVSLDQKVEQLQQSVNALSQGGAA